jgi:hypothetical protein
MQLGESVHYTFDIYIYIYISKVLLSPSPQQYLCWPLSLMKITMITQYSSTTVGQDGMKKLLHVPTRPRTKLVRKRSKKISRSCLISFIKSLELSEEELQEKIRKLKYSRDYSFLFSHDQKIKPYLVKVSAPNDSKKYLHLVKRINSRREKVEAFDHNKKLKVGARNSSQEYIQHVKQSYNRKCDSKKVEDLNHKYKVTTQNCFPKFTHHRTHEISYNYYRRGRQARSAELGHIREMS